MRRNITQDLGQTTIVYTGNPEPIRPGKKYRFCDGKPYTVGMKNPCRARLDPAFRVRREIVSRLHDIRRTIYATPPSVNISPNTELPPILDL